MNKPSTPFPSFADMLCACRSHRGLTLAALAESSGLTVPHLSNLEHCRRAPSPEHAVALADALCLKPAERRRWLSLAGLAHVPPGLREVLADQLPD